MDDWPRAVRTDAEEVLIANARRRISVLMDLDANYLTRETGQDLYGELIFLRNLQTECKQKRTLSTTTSTT